MHTHYSAGIVTVYKKENTLHYLVLHYTAGHWDLPKGHLEEGETEKEAALRELHEETGLNATISPDFTYEFSYDFIDHKTGMQAHKKVTFFVGFASCQTVILSDEHQDFLWLEYEKALKQLTYENARDLVSLVQNFILKQEVL